MTETPEAIPGAGVVIPGLHVIYRSTGTENTKGRPSFYSKTLALTSFVRAMQEVASAEILYLNDGGIPTERCSIMHATGEITTVRCGSNRRSYRLALNMAATLAGRQGWHPDDIMWFAEDDYLYTPDSMTVLMNGATTHPDADYFSLYSPAEIVAGASGPDGWFPAVSTTSTFGVRVRALLRDIAVLRLCPFTGGAWDHTTCLVVRGEMPFAWKDLWADLLPTGLPARMWPRRMVRGVMRVIVLMAAWVRRGRGARMLAYGPLPIWHMEATVGEDPRWARVAQMVGDSRG